MKTWWGNATAAGIGCAVALGASTAFVDAQEGGGFDITGTFSNELEIGSEKSLFPGGTTTTLKTGLSFGLSTETAVSKLSVGTGANLRYRDAPGKAGSAEISDPNFRLSYNREGVTSKFDVSARVSVRNINDFVLIDADGDFVKDDLVYDSGDVVTSRFNAEYATGVGTPLRFDANVTSDVRDYTGVTKTEDLYDRSYVAAGLSSTFLMTETLTGRVFVQTSEYDADDEDSTLRKTQTYGAGFRYEIDPALTLSGQFAINDFETTTVGLGVVTTTAQSVSSALGMTRALANGAVSVTYATDVSPFTTRSTLRADRKIERPDGALTYGLGVSASDTGDTTYVGALIYTRELPTGELSASFRRVAQIDRDDEEVALTSVGLTYLREVTPASNWEVDFGLGTSESIGLGASNNTTRAELTISYSQELAEDWEWNVGYRGVYSDDGGSATSSAVFTTLDRKFALRP